MRLCRIGVSGLLVLLLIVPLVAVAQDAPAGPRGDIQVLNDGKKPAKITLWSHSGKPDRSHHWKVAPGQTEFLSTTAGKRIKAPGSAQISLGKRTPVAMEQVAQFQEGSWYVSIRALRRASRRGSGVPPAQERAYPPGQGPGVPPSQEPMYPPGQGPGVPPAQERAYPPGRGSRYPSGWETGLLPNAPTDQQRY